MKVGMNVMTLNVAPKSYLTLHIISNNSSMDICTGEMGALKYRDDKLCIAGVGAEYHQWPENLTRKILRFGNC
jgi:hypothetical protein